ncbi:hypothetical protein QQP08_010269 [Theobroma cacao]|nr:hypothetical protein QQP08_010269 [Theobroma cacao]
MSQMIDIKSNGCWQVSQWNSQGFLFHVVLPLTISSVLESPVIWRRCVKLNGDPLEDASPSNSDTCWNLSLVCGMYVVHLKHPVHVSPLGLQNQSHCKQMLCSFYGPNFHQDYDLQKLILSACTATNESISAN